jgi:hypothetical protein
MNPLVVLVSVPGWPIAFRVRLFAAFIGALFRSSISAFPLEVIDASFRV